MQRHRQGRARGETIAKTKVDKPLKTLKVAARDQASRLADSNGRAFKTLARKREARRKPPPEPQGPPLPFQSSQAGLGGSLRNVRLQDVLKRRVVVLVSRESSHGSFTRGDVFLITGKDEHGWKLREADAQGEPAGRPCSRVLSMTLQLLEANPQ